MSGFATKRVGRKCHVGQCVVESRYECPRCGVPYCSVSCYKEHSSACVREFEEDGRREAMQSVRATNEEQVEMRRILARLDAEASGGNESADPHAFPDFDRIQRERREEDDDGIFWNESESDSEGEGDGELGDDQSFDDDSDESRGGDGNECLNSSSRSASDADEADALEELLEDLEHTNISLDDALRRLPRELVDDFQKQLGDGRISRLVNLWQPWWLLKEVSVGDDERSEGEDETWSGEAGRTSDVPKVPHASDYALSPEVALARASSLVVYSVVDVLMSYTLALRFHNGDWQTSPSSVSQDIWKTSGSLSADARHGSCTEAANCVSARAIHKEAVVEAALDASAILRFSRGAERALLETQKITSAGSMGQSRTARGVVKKVGFLLSYAAGISRDPNDCSRVELIAGELVEWADAERAKSTHRQRIQNEPSQLRGMQLERKGDKSPFKLISEV